MNTNRDPGEGWIEALLTRGQIFEVGGSVRDQLLGRKPWERDYLVRGLELERVMEILEQFGSVAYVGSAFGVLKFSRHDGSEVVDIALPRVERSTGGGHTDFAVEFDPNLPLERDLGRRDFSVNAMARTLPGGDLVDPHGGRRDLERRSLRMIFPGAFDEDPLRILRGARFAAQLDFDIEESTLGAMRSAVNGFQELSAERIGDELDKIMQRCVRPSAGIEILRKIGALDILIPELSRGVDVDQHPYHPEDVYRHSLTTCDLVETRDPVIRWAALLHDIGKVETRAIVEDEAGRTRTTFYGHERVGAERAGNIMSRLRRSNDVRKRVELLVREHMYFYTHEWSDGSIRRFLKRVGEDNLEALFQLRAADRLAKGDSPQDPSQDEFEERIRGIVKEDAALHVGDLRIGGRDLMEATGIPPGKLVGKILQALLERVLDDPSLNDRTTLIRLAKEIVSGEEGNE